MTKKHFLNEILSPKLLVITWGFIIVVCVFIGFSMRGQCASSQKKLPYDYSWNYFAIPEQTLNVALNHASAYFDTSTDNVIVFWYEIGNGSWLYQFCVAQVDSITYDSGYTYDTTDLTLNKITLHFSHSVIGFTDGNSLIDPGNQSYAPQSFTFFGSNAVYVQPTGVITETYTHMPLYGTVELDGKLIIGTPEVLVNGHATPPDLTGDNIGNDKPDIDNYLPNIPNMPSLDNSSLEKIAESIFNILQWGFNALKGTITGLFEYLGDLLSYSFQKVIDNIKNVIQNLYDNFVSLFEPLLNSINEILDSIRQKLDYISQPFDSELLQEAFENTAINGDIDSISQLNEQAFGTWSTTEEPNEFKIALHTENIPLANNVNFTTTTQYIDLGVINGAKPYIRGIMWCLLTFSLLYTIIDSIPNYIGGNDE